MSPASTHPTVVSSRTMGTRTSVVEAIKSSATKILSGMRSLIDAVTLPGNFPYLRHTHLVLNILEILT